jgi:predicted nucleic acid-binding protein
VIVVDTNVIAYFYIQSDHTTLAEAVMRTDSAWAAPRLWRSEFRNVLHLYLRKGELELKGAVEKMREAESTIGENEYDVLSSKVLKLAHESGCTAYDCEFVSLAEGLNISLVTSDKKLIAAFPSIALSMKDFTTL